MEQTKEQTLSTLYALRAGLSVISQKKDEVTEITDKSVTALSDGVENGINIVPYGILSEDEKKTYKFPNNNKKFLQKLLNDEMKDAVEKEKMREKSALPGKKLLRFLALLLTVLTFVGEGVCIYYIVHFFINDSGWAWLCILAAVAGGLGIYAEIGLFCSEAIDSVSDSECHIIACDKFLAGLPELKANIEDIQKTVQTNKKSITTIKSGCEELYVALQKEFNNLLDARDWKNLDLVIYYFETRRADSVKEALQLVDREMQTQRIEKIIVAATKQICNTLAVGFTMLQNTMESCFNSLSAQIAQSTGAISSQLSGLTSAVNMNNALQAKANVTSEQLMNDVYYIRKYQL